MYLLPVPYILSLVHNCVDVFVAYVHHCLHIFVAYLVCSVLWI